MTKLCGSDNVGLGQKELEADAQTFVPLNAQSIGYLGVYSGDEFSSEELKQAAFQQTSNNPAYKFMALQLAATLLKDDRINIDLEPIAEPTDDETLDETKVQVSEQMADEVREKVLRSGDEAIISMFNKMPDEMFARVTQILNSCAPPSGV